MKNMPFRKIFIFLSLTISLSLLTGCANHQQQHTADHNKTEKHSPATQQRFTNIERWVKAFEDPARDSWQKPDEVVRTMGLVAGDVVADIGAGTGYFTRRFAVAVGPVPVYNKTLARVRSVLVQKDAGFFGTGKRFCASYV